MRKYLFHGKRTDNGQWVEGAFIPDALESVNGAEVDWGFIRFYDTTVGKMQTVEVERASVGQYIGRKDKNGKKIFEGDLLNGFDYPFYCSEDNVHNYFAEIVWFDENCSFGLVTHKHPTSNVRGISAGNTDYIEEFDLSKWEVIGNIHDNPELLEG